MHVFEVVWQVYCIAWLVPSMFTWGIFLGEYVANDLLDAAWRGVLSCGACLGITSGLCNLVGGWDLAYATIVIHACVAIV